MLDRIKQQLPKILFPVVVASGVAFISNGLSARYAFVLPHTPPPYLQQQKKAEEAALKADTPTDETDMQETARRLNEIEPESR